jgi:hypothetical protein
MSAPLAAPLMPSNMPAGPGFDATSLPHRSLREPAAEHADGSDLRLAGTFCVVGGIPYRNSVGAFQPKFLENDFEDVRRRLRFFGALGRGLSH